jgi:8-oxo-dGTP diphosphatase
VPKGHEGQALAWVPRHKLASYAMPSADRPVVAALLQADRYLVTPAPEPGADDRWLAALQRALDDGVRRLQLRASPDIDAARWSSLVATAVTQCRLVGAEVLVNSDVKLARRLEVGVHLRASQLRQLHARPLPQEFPVAASCHDGEELALAEAIGCDFAVLGPVSSTASHPDTAGIGWDAFASLREEVALPLYAIGGLAVDDIATARAHGAQGIAAIRALWPGFS